MDLHTTQCPDPDTLQLHADGSQAWPLVAHCGSLTRLRLKCLPAFLERLPDAWHSLRELQLTYAYAMTPVAGYDTFHRVCTPVLPA